MCNQALRFGYQGIRRTCSLRNSAGKAGGAYSSCNEGTSHYVLEETKQPLYVEDTAMNLPNGRPAIRAEFLVAGVKTMVYLPLLRKQKAVGILYVDLLTPYHFTQNDKLVLELFASQAAVAIENSLLFAELDERAERLERLQAATAAITAKSHDLESVLHAIVDNVSSVFENPPCAIRLFDQKSGQFGKRVATGLFEDWWNLPPRLDGTSQYVIAKGEPLYIDDTSKFFSERIPNVRSEFLDLRVRAIAHLPLIGPDEEMMGVLYVDLLTPHRSQRMTSLFWDFS